MKSNYRLLCPVTGMSKLNVILLHSMLIRGIFRLGRLAGIFQSSNLAFSLSHLLCFFCFVTCHPTFSRTRSLRSMRAFREPNSIQGTFSVVTFYSVHSKWAITSNEFKLDGKHHTPQLTLAGMPDRQSDRESVNHENHKENQFASAESMVRSCHFLE